MIFPLFGQPKLFYFYFYLQLLHIQAQNLINYLYLSYLQECWPKIVSHPIGTENGIEMIFLINVFIYLIANRTDKPSVIPRLHGEVL